MSSSITQEPQRISFTFIFSEGEMRVANKEDVHSATNRQENVDMYIIYMVTFGIAVYLVMGWQNEKDNYPCLRDES